MSSPLQITQHAGLGPCISLGAILFKAFSIARRGGIEVALTVGDIGQVVEHRGDAVWTAEHAPQRQAALIELFRGGIVTHINGDDAEIVEAERGSATVFQPASKLERTFMKRPCRGVIRTTVGQRAGGVQHLPRHGGRSRLFEAQCGVDPADPFAEQAAKLPETSERRTHEHQDITLHRSLPPSAARRADWELQSQALAPFSLTFAHKRGSGALGKLEKCQRVAAACLFGFGCIEQAFLGVLAHSFQQIQRGCKPSIRLSRLACCNSASAGAASGPAHGLGGRLSDAAGKNAQPREHVAPLRGQQLIAPGDRVAQRPLPRRQVARPACQERQAPLELESSSPGDSSSAWAAASSIASGSPSRRRQIAATSMALALSTSKRAPTARARSANNATAAARTTASGSPASILGRQSQRLHTQAVFGAHCQGSATGGKYVQAGTGREQLGDQRRAVQHVLEIIEQQQRLPLAQPLHQGSAPRARTTFAHTQSFCDRRPNLRRVAQRRQLDQKHAVREVEAQAGCSLQAQSRLADTGRPEQRHHSHVAARQQCLDRPELTVAADQPSRRSMEVGRHRRATPRHSGSEAPSRICSYSATVSRAGSTPSPSESTRLQRS